MIITVISVIATLIIIIGTVLTLIAIKNLNAKKQQEVVKSTTDSKKAKADEIKKQALKATADGDATKAKQLLLEAQANYKEINDTNNVVDTAALLYLIEHPTPQQGVRAE